MSEPILNAIIKLFALVAREGSVSKEERHHIESFLNDHVGQRSVGAHLHRFDEYCEAIAGHTPQQEAEDIKAIANEINQEVAQKQKSLIMIELLSSVLTDGTITDHEDSATRAIGKALNISEADQTLMRYYVLGQKQGEFENEAILSVDSNPSYSGKGRHIHRKDLDGIIAILYLSSTESFFFKYVGHTDVYLNSVPQKPNNINALAIGSLIRWGHTDPVYYGDILGVFKKLGDTTRTSFEGVNISFTFKNGRLGLRDVNINEESGNLVALMGASGAGKSTLLHVLNGTEKPSSGKVLINGIDIHKDPKKIEGVIGFVPQDDLLIEDLTVYQNLYFAAKLCFSHLTEKAVHKLVMTTLEDLGLIETKDLKVGSPLRKTISGGQRKRLNIGLELLREPAVLFCDEPTSGLSSRDSENIIDLLKELSLKGKLVFTVIHQPSSDIFKMFDKLVILDTGGFQIYYGNPVDAVSYFKQNINLINSDEGECTQCGNVNPEQIFNIIETKVINEYGNFTSERKFSPEQWNQIYLQKSRSSSVERATETPHSTLSIPTWFKQTKLFSARDVLSKLSNQQYIMINLLEAPLLAFILAFIVRYYNPDDPFRAGYIFSKNLNMPAYLFMSVIVALFMGLTVSAEEIIRDRKILKREAFLHLSRSSYIISKIGILFMISAIQTALFVAIGNYILNIHSMFLTHWAILFTVSCFANLLGLNISSAFNSAVTIYILIPVLLIPQLILSGVVVKFDKLNPVIGNTATVPFVGDLMASRWAFEAAMVAQYKDNQFERQFYPWDKVMAESDFKKIYFIPALETKLGFVNMNINNPEPGIKSEVIKSLDLMRNEISRELESVHKNDFRSLDKFTPEKYDSSVFNETTNFFEALKKFYVSRYNAADRDKEKMVNHMTGSVEQEKEFENLRHSHQNEAITELVKNMAETNRIIEQDGRLVQKFYPVYKDPDPDHIVDFDAQFYMPAKHFLNQNIDTFFFNLGVIWSMTLVLTITLYFEALKKIVDGLSNISNPLPKRM
ncbi:MAG TPA: ATP-binding cassette domain-containing protein [Cyclobacteriaceae bacterium]|nr:ATP-binding cassette domain-containing protein [Cyclobacteriaceae bacterium]